jgi:ABC-type glycerol-3-phosphate transport system substrate-binding protein
MGGNPLHACPRRVLIRLAAILALGYPSAQLPIDTSLGPTEIRFVAWKYHLVGQEEYYRDLAQAFERAHPEYKLSIKLDDWNSAHDRIRGWISQRQGPDLTIVPDVWLAEFAPGLDVYAGKLPASFVEAFNPTMLERSRLHGQVLGLVWAASTKALFYRTDLFKQAGIGPPHNWNELLSSAQKLNQPPALFGLALPGAPALDTADNFYFFLWGNGGRLFSPDGRPSLGSPEAVEAIAFMRDLVSKYRVTEPEVVRCDRPCAEDLFVRGKAAMVETGPWLIRSIAGRAQPVPFSVAPLPVKKEAITQLVTDHLVLLGSSQEKTAALQFVQFAYQPSWRLRWARLGMVPELKTVENDQFFREDPVWRVFISALGQARWIPLMKWEPIDRAIRDGEAKVLTGQAEPREALESLASEVQALIAKQ